MSLCAGSAPAELDSTDIAPPPPPPSAYLNDCAGGGGGSQQGYPDASPTASTDVFTSSFPCILDGLAADPATPSSSPGGVGPVDLSLKPADGGFQPANPLVDVTLPTDLGGQFALGDRGVELDAGATDPSAAAAADANPLVGQGLLYADAAPATDLAVAPISVGLEAIYQLRAPESPDRLTMGLTVPDGANLEPADDGGVQVVQGVGRSRTSAYQRQSMPPATRLQRQ